MSIVWSYRSGELKSITYLAECPIIFYRMIDSSGNADGGK
jgi:hypothetical protein